MHHFVYPTQDAYVSNKSSEKNKNFGLDEMLIIGVSHSYAKVVNNTKTYSFNNEYVAGMPLQSYTGKATGSFYGSSTSINGTIDGGNNLWIASYFSGSVTGSLVGSEVGSPISGQFSGSLNGFYGTIDSYAVSGWVSGSITSNCFSTFTGTLTNATGSFSGYLLGAEVKQEQNTVITTTPFINRTFIKFNLDVISESIARGDIIDPTFWLRIKTTEARELPSSYTIYSFPVSQSWDQGDGYFSDGGSNNGISWNYRDDYSGSTWFSPYTNSPLTSSVDYLGNYGYVSESFKRGGGTWYNIPCSQTFGYETADINMDVTSIVSSWIAGGLRNDGFVLMMSEETNTSASNAHVFYFSKETNTVFMPKLDVAWDDSEWVTGSFGTGSVTITSYEPRLSGSITAPVQIIGITVTGSLSGNAYFNIDDVNGYILSGSMVNITGLNGNMKDLDIDGKVYGFTSQADASGTRLFTITVDSGDFYGCVITGQYSSSMVTGQITGSFNQQLMLNHSILGIELPGPHEFNLISYQDSPASGKILGDISYPTSDSGLFQGVAISGNLKGATLSIPFTGSWSWVTASFSTTSSVGITGSYIQPIDVNKPFVVIVQDLKKEYTFGDMPRINLFARERFPLKTFGKSTQQPVYTTPRLLPSSSFYSIKDNETEEIIVDFDNYTKISCDPNGHYFYLDTTGLEKERYYKVLIRVVFDNGNSYTFDSIDLFKVRR